MKWKTSSQAYFVSLKEFFFDICFEKLIGFDLGKRFGFDWATETQLWSYRGGSQAKEVPFS